jgi:hypothetical protein
MTRWAGAPTIETYESHPFLAALEAGELDEEVARGYAGGSGVWYNCASHYGFASTGGHSLWLQRAWMCDLREHLLVTCCLETSALKAVL